MSILQKKIRHAHSGISARLRTSRLKINPAKKTKNEKGWGQKCSGFFEGCTTLWLRISGHRVAGIFIDFMEEPKSLGDQFDECISRKLHYVTQASEKQTVARENSSQSSSSAQSVHFEISGSVSGGDRKTGATCPRRRVEISQKYLEAQRKGQNYFFLTYRSLVSPSTIRNKTGGKRNSL